MMGWVSKRLANRKEKVTERRLEGAEAGSQRTALLAKPVLCVNWKGFLNTRQTNTSVLEN